MASYIRFLGPVSDEVLTQAYAAARLLVFPVMESAHDVEGFGMVAIEAAAHGVPTVAFAAGGVTDAVAPGISGELVPPGDYRGIAEAILRNVSVEPSVETRDQCRKFAAAFSWERYGEKLVRICLDTVGSQEPA